MPKLLLSKAALDNGDLEIPIRTSVVHSHSLCSFIIGRADRIAIL